MYKVFKDHGEEIAEYKTLAAAKKLAEKEHGEVFCNGEQVYPAQPTTNESQDEQHEAQVDEAQNSTDAIDQETQDRTGLEGRYRIESLMNVRLRPALNGDIVGIAQPGTVVTVTGIQNDWMAVKNGTETVYILFGGGRYATKV